VSGRCRLSSHIAQEVDNAVAALAAEQWGVLSLAELRTCGVSDTMVSDRVKRGHLHRLYRGVYAVGHPSVPVRGRFLAAVKACGPTARLSHFSAAALYGIVVWDDRYPEVTVTGTTTRTHKGISVHRSKHTEGVTRRHGIPVTSPAQSLIDLSSVPRFKALRRATREARRLGLITPAEAARIVPDGYVPTRSELEDAVLDLILDGGLEPPQVNVPLVIDGRRVIPDFRWPQQRLVVEADGAWHDDRLARADDADRQALLEAHGERVIRVSWDQATRRRRQTLARLLQAGAPIAATPANFAA
jgi:very-short-patch-repair endonuclease